MKREKINEKTFRDRGSGLMILTIIFFLGLLSGVINSRSVTVTRKIHNAPYGFIPLGQRPLPTIIAFLGGPIAISAIVIWGFISINWFYVIISWIICGAICRLLVEKKFNFPLSNLILFYSDLFTILCALTLWILYFVI